MFRTKWQAAALVTPMLVALAAAPAQAAPDRTKLRAANQRLTIAAPAARIAARSGSAAAAGPGPVQVSQSCDPATIAVKQNTTCTLTAENTGSAEATVELATVSTLNLPMTAATGASLVTPFLAHPPRATLAGSRPAGPASVAPDPGSIFGFLPLEAFGGNTSIPLGDEQIANLDVPGFVFNDTSYAKVGISSNGYLVAGGSDDPADQAEPGSIPDPSRPNSIIAPFWTDLDGAGDTYALANVLTDGVSNWLVIQWQGTVAGTGAHPVFQVWAGLNGAQDIQFAYKFDTLSDPGQPLVVGAENAAGTAGARLPDGVVPSTDLRVTSSAGQAGGKVSYTVTMKGLVRGPGQVVTVAKSPKLKPVTVTTPVTVQR
jgi:hypothetical protein